MSAELSKLMKSFTNKYRSLSAEDSSHVHKGGGKRNVNHPVGGGGGSNRVTETVQQALKAAFTFSKKEPVRHLQRQQEVNSLCRAAADSSQNQHRYIHFPVLKSLRSRSLEDTHVYLTASSKTFTHPNRTPEPAPSPTPKLSVTSRSSLARCLRKHKLREKSKSDNALQRLGVHHHHSSDDALQKLGVRRIDQVFPTVTVGLASSVAPSPQKQKRSRSLERNEGRRIVHTSPVPLPSSTLRHTRSLERNHKFLVNPKIIYKDRKNQWHIGGEAVVTVEEMPRGQSGSFINKPARGWLHSDVKIAHEGMTYGVRYIGCLAVNTSMKTLDFETRSQIAKECINRVCEAAGLKTADKKKKVDKRVLRMLGDTADMRNAGQDVTLCINSETLTLTSLDEGTLVAQHDMPNISFASGGDPDTLDFVAYVAKDRLHGRCCWVLECCGRNSAQDVITTIGQAFELRFKECLKRTPRQEGPGPIVFNGAVGGDAAREVKVIRDDPEYYNDLPGKVPPGPDAPPVPPLPDYNSPSSTLSSRSSEVTVIPGNLREDASSQRPNRESIGNLIDLTTEAIPANHPVHDYVNDCMAPQQREHSDPFDIPPPELGVSARMAVPPKPLPPSQRSQLEAEGWFHGPISRREAEQKLSVDGDFLVRESQGSPGQYVLTGMQAGVKKHLLLVDPEGVVRTKDRTYESVSHLISYHRDNGLPIISAESALLLKSPVMRQPVPR